MPLDKCLNQFTSLNTDRNRNNWTADTCHRAQHKPFLLLSVMDLIAQGQIKGNLIEPSFELVDTWNGYWQAAMLPGKTSSVAYPFFFMKSGMQVSEKPSSAFTTTTVPCAAFACRRPRGTPWWKPPTSFPGVRARTTFPPTACASAGFAIGHSMRG